MLGCCLRVAIDVLPRGPDLSSSSIPAVSGHPCRRRAHERLRGELPRRLDPFPLSPVPRSLATVFVCSAVLRHRRRHCRHLRFRRPHTVVPPFYGLRMLYTLLRVFAFARTVCPRPSRARRRVLPRVSSRWSSVELGSGLPSSAGQPAWPPAHLPVGRVLWPCAPN